MWHFLTALKLPPQKKAELSETDACYEKDKRKREPQSTWKDKQRFLISALLCVGFSTGQPRIHQGNQIHVFGCLAFEIGTTWIFF